MSVNPQQWFQAYINRLKNKTFGLDPNSPSYKAAFAEAFKVDPATQQVLDKGLASLNLTPDQQRAEVAANASLRLGIKGQEQQLSNAAQAFATDNTLRLNEGNTELLGKRKEQDTDAYLTRNKGLTQNQIELINATTTGQRALQSDLLAAMPQFLQHEKDMDQQNFSQNLPFMLGQLAMSGALLFG